MKWLQSSFIDMIIRVVSPKSVHVVPCTLYIVRDTPYIVEQYMKLFEYNLIEFDSN